MLTQLHSGASVRAGLVETINGKALELPAPTGRTHVQFRSFTGCPICHLHLRSYAEMHHVITEAGITEVLFCQAPTEELRGYRSALPFTVIADPHRAHYRTFGVEEGLRAFADTRIRQTAVHGGTAILDLWEHLGQPVQIDDGIHLGLPADFLLDPDGTVVAAHYGVHPDDHWSVCQLLDIHRTLRETRVS